MDASSTPVHSLGNFEFSSTSSTVQKTSTTRNHGNGYDLGEFVERTDSSASSTSSWDLLQQEPTTIVELGSETPSEYDMSMNGHGMERKQPTNEDDFVESMRAKIMEEVGGQNVVHKMQAGLKVSPMVWAAGKKSATRFYNLYANIDVFRPYFDVEPKDVLKRLANSLLPRKPIKPQTVPGELYGPVMLVFTLIALLLFSMKSSGHVVQEGTLMGTAIGVSFGYWIGGSALYFFVAYLCNSHITFLQVLTLTGYGLFGHCLSILFTSAMYHNSHITFYVTWMMFGGLATVKMVSVYVSRTWSRRHGILIGGVVAALHMLALIYFHFAYHSVYEDTVMLLSRTKRETMVPVIVENSVLQFDLQPSTFLTNKPASIMNTLKSLPNEAVIESTIPRTVMLF